MWTVSTQYLLLWGKGETTRERCKSNSQKKKLKISSHSQRMLPSMPRKTRLWKHPPAEGPKWNCESYILSHQMMQVSRSCCHLLYKRRLLSSLNRANAILQVSLGSNRRVQVCALCTIFVLLQPVIIRATTSTSTSRSSRRPSRSAMKTQIQCADSSTSN